MNDSPLLKQALSTWLPPGLIRLLRHYASRPSVHWSGDYGSWEDARSAAGDYNAPAILERVLAATLAVASGSAVYERDSVLFDQVDYSWPLLSGLMWAAARHGGRLDVLDFGGSLGSTYYQVARFVRDFPFVRWSIVEQENFVECGRSRFQSDRLRFYKSVSACCDECEPFVAILSGVLQYLPDPHTVVRQIGEAGFEHVILDRTSFNIEPRDRLTVQTVPDWIYPASYPCWFFDEERFRKMLETYFEVVTEFESFDRSNIPSRFKGFILQRR